jgi:hypothetical protein
MILMDEWDSVRCRRIHSNCAECKVTCFARIWFTAFKLVLFFFFM